MKALQSIVFLLLMCQVLQAQEDSVHTFTIRKTPSVELVSCCNEDGIHLPAPIAGARVDTTGFRRRGGLVGPTYDIRTTIFSSDTTIEAMGIERCNWESGEQASLQRPRSTKNTGVIRLCYEVNDVGQPVNIIVKEGTDQYLISAAKNYLRTSEIKNLDAKLRMRAESDKPVRFALSVSFYQESEFVR